MTKPSTVGKEMPLVCSQDDIRAFIGAHATQLKRLAEQARLGTLAKLLDMVELEAGQK